jgi:hypothetical protein
MEWGKQEGTRGRGRLRVGWGEGGPGGRWADLDTPWERRAANSTTKVGPSINTGCDFQQHQREPARQRTRVWITGHANRIASGSGCVLVYSKIMGPAFSRMYCEQQGRTENIQKRTHSTRCCDTGALESGEKGGVGMGKGCVDTHSSKKYASATGFL